MAFNKPQNIHLYILTGDVELKKTRSYVSTCDELVHDYENTEFSSKAL